MTTIYLKNNNVLDYNYIKNEIDNLEHIYITYKTNKAHLESQQYTKKYEIDDLREEFIKKFHKPTFLIKGYFNFYYNKIVYLLDKVLIKKDLITHYDTLHLKLQDLEVNYQEEDTEIKYLKKHLHLAKGGYAEAFRYIYTVKELNNTKHRRRLFLINYYMDLINNLQPLIERLYKLDKKYGFQKSIYVRNLNSIDLVKLSHNINYRFTKHIRNQKCDKGLELHNRLVSIKKELAKFGFNFNIEDYYDNVLHITHPIEYRFYKQIGRKRIEMNLGNLFIINEGDYTEIEKKERKDRTDSLDSKYIKPDQKKIKNVLDFNVDYITLDNKKANKNYLKKHEIYFTTENPDVFLSDFEDFYKFLMSDKDQNDILIFKQSIEKHQLSKQLLNF